ncbi:MAG: lipopolysaccharide export system protein LptC [Candidatus Midichloriaceae bacterium]|jgi:lipopolysaccharide export system protein LptC
MRRKKIYKLSLICTLMMFSMLTIFNYYMNVADSEDIVEENTDATSTTKMQYESIIHDPKYYFQNNEMQQLFIKADIGVKTESEIIMDKIFGTLSLSKKMEFEYKAKKAVMDVKKKDVVFSGGIVVNTNKNAVLETEGLLINYNQYSISSNRDIRLKYNNIDITANGLYLDKKLILTLDNPKIKIYKK